jgi:hypothetical protein
MRLATGYYDPMSDTESLGGSILAAKYTKLSTMDMPVQMQQVDIHNTIKCHAP